MIGAQRKAGSVQPDPGMKYYTCRRPITACTLLTVRDGLAAATAPLPSRPGRRLPELRRRWRSGRRSRSRPLSPGPWLSPWILRCHPLPPVLPGHQTSWAVLGNVEQQYRYVPCQVDTYIVLLLYVVIVIVIIYIIVIVCCHCYCYILYLVWWTIVWWQCSF